MAENITLTNLANLTNDTTVVNAINGNNAIVTNAFTDVLSRSGIQPNQMQANLDMNSNQILNLPAPSTPNSPFRLVDASSTVINVTTTTINPVGPFVVGDLLYANGTTSLGRLADVATGSILVSGGVGVAPAWSSTFPITTVGALTTGALTVNPSAGSTGISMLFIDSPSGLNIVNVPQGSPGSYPNGAYGVVTSLRYTVSGDSSDNPGGVYGQLWYASAHNFTGAGAAGKFNVYTVPVLTATIANGGANNVVGDVLTIVGGTCNTFLNSPPTFVITAAPGGVVTAVTYQNQSACSVYPSNPVTTTSTNGGATPPTLNITNHPVNVTYLIGLYGRSRHTAVGTVTNNISVQADGCWAAAGGGITTNCMGVWVQPPYPDAGPTNSYGVFFNGAFAQGSLATLANTDITVTVSGSGSFRVSGQIHINTPSSLIVNDGTWNNGAGAGAGTLTNAPSAGNPTKWIPIIDNGITRYIPAW